MLCDYSVILHHLDPAIAQMPENGRKNCKGDIETVEATITVHSHSNTTHNSNTTNYTEKCENTEEDEEKKLK